MNLSIELYHLPNNHANWLTLLLNRAFSAYYAQYRYRSPTSGPSTHWVADDSGPYYGFYSHQSELKKRENIPLVS